MQKVQFIMIRFWPPLLNSVYDSSVRVVEELISEIVRLLSKKVQGAGAFLETCSQVCLPVVVGVGSDFSAQLVRAAAIGGCIISSHSPTKNWRIVFNVGSKNNYTNIGVPLLWKTVSTLKEMLEPGTKTQQKPFYCTQQRIPVNSPPNFKKKLRYSGWDRYNRYVERRKWNEIHLTSKTSLKRGVHIYMEFAFPHKTSGVFWNPFNSAVSMHHNWGNRYHHE